MTESVPPAACSPLAALAAALARDGRIPLPWIVAHAPDGDLRDLWHDWDDPRALALLATAACTPASLAQVLGACAWRVVGLIPPAVPEFGAALVALGAWSRGRASDAELRRSIAAAQARIYAVDIVDDTVDEFGDMDVASALSLERAERAVHAAHAVLAASHASLARKFHVPHDEATHAIESAMTAFASTFAPGTPDRERLARTRALFAEVIRDFAPCPTVAGLLAAYPRV